MGLFLRISEAFSSFKQERASKGIKITTRCLVYSMVFISRDRVGITWSLIWCILTNDQKFNQKNIEAIRGNLRIIQFFAISVDGKYP